MKHVVDSSGWLEYFANTKNAQNFSDVIEDTENLMVSTIILYEVFKKILQERGEDLALKIVGHMKQSQVVDITTDIALYAAKISSELKVPMADSLILATAKVHNVTLWTQDADFKEIEGVQYFPKF